MSIVGNSPQVRAQRLLSFVHSHKGVLNLLVHARPALLEGSFSALIKVSQLRSYLGFNSKRKYFFSQLRKRRPEYGRRSVHLQLRRGQVFEDSFHQLRMRTSEEMRGRLQVNFHGEEGIDAGGLTREWYLVLSREIFNPNYALFTAAADGATFQPNPLSMINMNHLDYFKFVGRVIGKAICDSQLMDAHFTRSFYKHVLGNTVDYTDIEAVEPEYYNSLKQILGLSAEDLEGLDLTFSAESQTFGKQEVIDLIPGGRNVSVMEENKADYVRLVAHHRMTAAIRSQIEAFLDGFYELVPPELISIFSPTELELLICGLPDVDIDELYAFTEYHQYRLNDNMIQWFWEVLRGFNREEKALFLQFVTGTSKVPLEGFGSLQGMRGVQRFSIHRAYGDIGLLPSAHTCFNQLDLPMYTSQEELRDKLLMAIKEGGEGFGFA
jgi:E3 ubiquitin-protein ligase HUWE1